MHQDCSRKPHVLEVDGCLTSIGLLRLRRRSSAIRAAIGTGTPPPVDASAMECLNCKTISGTCPGSCETAMLLLEWLRGLMARLACLVADHRDQALP